MGASDFDQATAVRRADAAASPSEAIYDVDVSPRWASGAGAIGGYLLSVAARALADDLGKPDPASLTAHFSGRVRPGPARVHVEAVRRGRTVATGQARVCQEGAERVRVLGAFTDLGRGGRGSVTGASAVEGLLLPGDGPPPLPDPDDCVPVPQRELSGAVTPIAERLDVRYAPGTPGWLHGEPGGTADYAAWVRVADGREPDALLLPTVLDALPPAVFDIGYRGWVPTVELTVHVRARPAPGWLRCRFRSRLAAAGIVEEDGEVWDTDGRLVAMSRQLALLPKAGRR